MSHTSMRVVVPLRKIPGSAEGRLGIPARLGPWRAPLEPGRDDGQECPSYGSETSRDRAVGSVAEPQRLVVGKLVGWVERSELHRPPSAVPSPSSLIFGSSGGVRFARPTVRLLCLLAAAAWLASAGTGWAQPLTPSAGTSTTDVPNELRGVGVTEYLNAQAPPELPFVDSSGKPVHLKDFFDGVRPVILTVNYSNCPMLCSMQLNGLFTGLQGVPWDIGRNFQIVTVSMDPTETPARAEKTKQKYLDLYGRPGVGGGWHVLTGRDEEIHRLTHAIGYHYAYDKQQKQYAHPAVVMILKPDGRVSRYLYGIEYDPQTLRLALVEAAEGKIGSTVDQMLLYCYHYDAERGRYGPAAMKVMQAGALVTLAAIVAMLVVFWRIGEKRARAKP